MTSVLPLCFRCLMLDRRWPIRRPDGSLPPYKCIAFPAGIPQEILTNQHDHREPYAGDNDVQFTPLDEEEEVPV